MPQPKRFPDSFTSLDHYRINSALGDGLDSSVRVSLWKKEAKINSSLSYMKLTRATITDLVKANANGRHKSKLDSFLWEYVACSKFPRM
jgi:hypothetical protein